MEHLQNIQDVFSDKILKVPDNQRGYAWDKKHWIDLIEDLEMLLPKQEHYTGTLVLHQDSDKQSVQAKDGTLLKLFDIVDGQQRITSIVILLNCIAQKLSEIPEKEEFANGIIEKFIKICKCLDKSATYMLSPLMEITPSEKEIMNIYEDFNIKELLQDVEISNIVKFTLFGLQLYYKAKQHLIDEEDVLPYIKNIHSKLFDGGQLDKL